MLNKEFQEQSDTSESTTEEGDSGTNESLSVPIEPSGTNESLSVPIQPAEVVAPSLTQRYMSLVLGVDVCQGCRELNSVL